ncbi:MAG: hypothetical protein CM15mP119_4110 [Alphaproteobacteria bacterium]|nr:MAG: hypothetical protein CM15mP119_4110 [Alphaproteobacteria bacterium]
MATGFHGFHVIIGTLFLTVCLFRGLKGHFTSEQHFGFEAAAWYWHFVDVVWLFLFVAVYWWGLDHLYSSPDVMIVIGLCFFSADRFFLLLLSSG